MDGKVVGYVYGVLRKVGDNEKCWKKIGDLNSLLVLKKYRRRGVADFMAKEFFSWLRGKRVKYVEASCNVKNQGVLKFNKKLGFKEQHVKFGKIL